LLEPLQCPPMMRLGTIGGAVLICLAILSGCGGSGGVDRDELAQSVKQSVEVALTESGESIEEATGSPFSTPRFLPLGEEPCQDPRKGQRAPTGKEPLYACYVNYEIEKPQDEVEWEVSIYSLDEGCWKGAVVFEEGGLGTPEFSESNVPQRRIDSGKEDLHGCIGKKPGSQGRFEAGQFERLTEEEAEQEAAEEAEQQEQEVSEAKAETATGEASGDSPQGAEQAGVEYGPPQNLESCGTIGFPPGQSEQRQVSGANLSCSEVKADVENLLEGQVPVQSHLPPGWSLSECANYEGTFLYCTHGDEAFAISAPTAFFLGE